MQLQLLGHGTGTGVSTLGCSPHVGLEQPPVQPSVLQHPGCAGRLVGAQARSSSRTGCRASKEHVRACRYLVRVLHRTGQPLLACVSLREPDQDRWCRISGSLGIWSQQQEANSLSQPNHSDALPLHNTAEIYVLWCALPSRAAGRVQAIAADSTCTCTSRWTT
jgi:hypothetical protein